MKKILLLLLFAVAFGFGQNADAFNDSRGITSDTESVEINEIDSVMYYNELVDRYESKAKREKIAYTALFSLGGAFFIGGTSLIVYDVAFRDYDKVDESSFPVGIMGYTLIVGSVAFIIGGVFLKIMGNLHEKRIPMYQEKSSDYAKRHSAYLTIAPIVDPVRGRLGSLTMLNW